MKFIGQKVNNVKVNFSNDGEIYVIGDDLYIENVTQDKDIIFKTNDGGTATEVMRIDGSTSNIGIGTSSPNRLLTLTNSTGGGAYQAFNSTSNNNTTIGSDGTGAFVVYDDTAGSYRMVVKASTGNVGIGTSSPSEKLEVSGKAIIRKSGSATAHGDTDLLVTDATAASSTAAIQILGGNAGFSNLQFSDTDSYSQGAIMCGHTDNYMAFKSNASE